MWNTRFPSLSPGKESACNAGDVGSTPGWGSYPGGQHGNPLQNSCLENPHGQRSLAGYKSTGSQRVGQAWIPPVSAPLSGWFSKGQRVNTGGFQGPKANSVIKPLGGRRQPQMPTERAGMAGFQQNWEFHSIFMCHGI